MAKSKSKSKSSSKTDSGSGSDNAETNNVKVHPCTLICIGLLCILIIMAAVVLVAIMTGALGVPINTPANNTWTRESRSRERKLELPVPDTRPDGIHVKFRFFAPPNANEISNYGLDEAAEFCKLRNGKLPVPRSVEEELRMIKDIEILHEEAKCSHYAIGYKLDENKRYSSLDREKVWPSLRVDGAAGTDMIGRDCVEIEVGQNAVLKIITSKPCHDVANLQHIVFLQSTPGHCEIDLWGPECLLYSREQSTEGFEQLASSRLSLPTGQIFSVLLLDKEVIPRRLLLPKYYIYKSTWLFEVKYVFNYLDIYESKLAPYKINVTLFQDPEKDCLAVNALQKFKIETVLCSEDTGCPACEIEPHQ